jgi:hypothetical protein
MMMLPKCSILNLLYPTFLPITCPFPLKLVIMMMLLLAMSRVTALSRISNSKSQKGVGIGM